MGAGNGFEQGGGVSLMGPAPPWSVSCSGAGEPTFRLPGQSAISWLQAVCPGSRPKSGVGWASRRASDWVGQTTGTYFSPFWRLVSLRSRCWPVQFLLKALFPVCRWPPEGPTS